MKNKIFLLATLSFGLISAGCATQNKATNNDPHAGMNHNTMQMDHSNMDHSTMQSSPNASTAPYDLQFLDTMMAHHQGAVDMAGSCGAKAQHAELKTLCTSIISSQQKEIADMKAWREKWFAGAAPAINMEMAGMSDSMKGMDMKALGTLTGNDFDLEFIRQMTPHHKGAVTMSEEAAQKLSKNEIKTLASEIIKAQQTEISQMAQWQGAWKK